MFNPSPHKEKIAGFEIPSFSSVVKNTCTVGNHIDFISIMRFLMINFIRFVKFNNKGSMFENFGKWGFTFPK